jgi:catechol 2,3-dioxygenase-like lactoylglutathione lyase family enzyme
MPCLRNGPYLGKVRAQWIPYVILDLRKRPNRNEDKTFPKIASLKRKDSPMSEIRHMAICTNNNRRLARFYMLILGMQEVWNEEQNSPHAFYVTDGYFNLNCLQIHARLAEQKRDVGINHYGFKIKMLKDIEERLRQLEQPIKLSARPADGRYTEYRIQDPDGNEVDIAERGWGTQEEKKFQGVRHVGIGTEEPERLADFYKFVFSMKEVARSQMPETNTKAVYLSDGGVNLALVKSSPIPIKGLQLLGFQVPSIKEVDERLKHARGLTYRGEPSLEIRHRPVTSPYKTVWLQDPDGNHVDLSEEGWEL